MLKNLKHHLKLWNKENFATVFQKKELLQKIKELDEKEGINLGGGGFFLNNKEKKELKLKMISKNFSFRRKLIGVKSLG